MRKLTIGIIDVLSRSASKSWYAHAMRANLASIMPQAIAVWCEEMGHEVHLAYYNGYENMVEALPGQMDVVFIGAFTQSAQLAYALSTFFRSKGAITVLGGPHAVSYPEDARQYFDYVLGFTDKNVISDVLVDGSPNRPLGRLLSAPTQPSSIPSVRARWKYVERLLEEAPFLKIVPMIGSLGCPYTCAFCVDSVVPYQVLNLEEIRDDLRFLRRTLKKKPVVAWHDPNFGVRFDDFLGCIEEAVPPGSIDFIAESTLSLLNESNVIRLKKAGFKAALPGIESWYDMGYKTRTGRTTGLAKVERVADQVNMILRHLPYLQANFVLGLDSDEGDEPFELTKLFLDLAPGAFPAFSLLTAFGVSAPLNETYRAAGRVLPFPHHMLNNTDAMNVRPLNYTWPEFYAKLTDLLEFAFSRRAIYRRFMANGGVIPRLFNVLRAVSAEGAGKIRKYRLTQERIVQDASYRTFLEQETTRIPEYMVEMIRRDLGPMWEWLPEGSLQESIYESKASAA